MQKTIDQIADLFRDKAQDALNDLVSSDCMININAHDIQEIIDECFGESVEFTHGEFECMLSAISFAQAYIRLARPYHALAPGIMTPEQADHQQDKMLSQTDELARKVRNMESRLTP